MASKGAEVAKSALKLVILAVGSASLVKQAGKKGEQMGKQMGEILSDMISAFKS